MKFVDAEKPQSTPVYDTTESIKNKLHRYEFKNSAKIKNIDKHFRILQMYFQISIIFYKCSICYCPKFTNFDYFFPEVQQL